MASPPPLTGLRVIELAGLAPAPFTSLTLADYGASVLRVDRPDARAFTADRPDPTPDTLTRRKASIAVDLKEPNGLALLQRLLKLADIFIDPFRPGVLESLGLSPDTLITANPRLIIARLTGFRRDGVFANMAGHDINYLGVSGILSQLGRRDGPPYPPANILADFAGGGLMCAFGILAALLSRTQTGKGQIVEANMVDGSAYLGTFMRYATKTPMWNQPRGENLLDGGCPWYDVYECADGGHMAVGALEPQFYAEFVRILGLDTVQSYDRATWPSMKSSFEKRFLQRTRPQWEEAFLGTDACCTPVLTQNELEAQNYEQRPAVGLSRSSGLAIPSSNAWESDGLSPGSGGEEFLYSWLGWKRGKDYDIEGGGLVQTAAPKL